MCWISRYPANRMIRVINQATESQGRTENSIRANQVYCQLCRMNYEDIRPNIGSTSETCMSQVLGSYAGSYRQLYRPKLPGTLQQQGGAKSCHVQAHLSLDKWTRAE